MKKLIKCVESQEGNWGNSLHKSREKRCIGKKRHCDCKKFQVDSTKTEWMAAWFLIKSEQSVQTSTSWKVFMICNILQQVSKYVQISTYLVQVVICFVSWRCLIQINDLEEVPFDHHFIKKLTRFSCTAVSKKHKIWKAKKNSRKYLQSPICSKMQTYWKTKRENFRTRNQWRQWMLECPMLWRITKHSLHNEGQWCR